MGMERRVVGYYTGNHFSGAVAAVVVITGVDVAVVEATWNGFGSRFHKWVHNVGTAGLRQSMEFHMGKPLPAILVVPHPHPDNQMVLLDEARLHGESPLQAQLKETYDQRDTDADVSSGFLGTFPAPC